MRSRSCRAICARPQVALCLIRTEYVAIDCGFCAGSRVALRSVRTEQIVFDLVPVKHWVGWVSQPLDGDREVVMILRWWDCSNLIDNATPWWLEHIASGWR